MSVADHPISILGYAYFFRVQSIVQAETPHRLHVLGGERCQEVPDLGHFVRHIVLAKDVSLDHTGLLGLDDIADALGQYSVAVIRAAIPGEEANEALPSCQSVNATPQMTVGSRTH